MSRLSPRFLVAAVLALLTFSCGIPDLAYFLGPPENVQSQAAPPTVSFDHNRTDNATEDFLGYEAYYKFYAYSPTPDDGAFGEDYAAISGISSGPNFPSQLTTRGFRRVYDSLDPSATDPPLIDIAPAEVDTDFTVSLTFPDRPSQLDPDPARAAFLSRTVLLTRAPVAAASGEAFDSDALSTDPADPDIPPGIPTTDDVIHMAIVLLAYGQDKTGNTFATIYSDPYIIDEPLVLSLR